jgi:rhodanese-related sulfurtransferase
MMPETTTRVAHHTASHINAQIYQQIEENVARTAAGGVEAINRRLAELDREWDMERALEANAATASLIGLTLGATVDRRWLVFPAVVAGFLLQHAVQGWCPPVPVLRRLGFRTQTEIDYEQAEPPRLGVLPEPPALRPEAFEALQRAGALVLDCRQAEAFAVHIPGALNVGLGPSFATWAGTVLPPEAAILLVLEDPGQVWEACWQLLRIGYALPKGLLAGGMLAWRTAGKALTHLPQWTVRDLQQHLERDRDLLVLDVRQPQEWREGHIAEALGITGAELPTRSDEVPRDRPVAVICGSGYRSSAMASLLQHRGHPHVMNVLGGMGAWRASGLKTVQD